MVARPPHPSVYIHWYRLLRLRLSEYRQKFAFSLLSVSSLDCRSRYFHAPAVSTVGQGISMRQPINSPSRVPRYQKGQEVVGFCDFLVKPLPWRGQRGLGLRLKPLIMKKGLGMLEDRRGIPALKPSLIKGL